MNKELISISILLFLDILWISLYMKHKYNPLILRIQNSPLELNVLSAVIAYAIMVFGLVHFVLPKLDKNSTFMDYFKNAFLFGAVLYGVYNFTCGSVFKNWDFSISVIDILWGGSVYALSAYFGILLSN